MNKAKTFDVTFIDPFYTSRGDVQTYKNILFGIIFNYINIA